MRNLRRSLQRRTDAMPSGGSYLTLPSSSSASFFPHNTNSDYSTKLARRINTKDGLWEVALAQALLPSQLINVNEGIFDVYFLHQGSLIPSRLRVSGGVYPTVAHLIHTLSTLIKDTSSSINLPFSKHVNVGYNRMGQRVWVQVKFPAVKVEVSKDLADVFGLESNVIAVHKESVEAIRGDQAVDEYEHDTRSRVFYAPRYADPRRGFDTFYIYCSLVSNQVVGDVTAPLLRTVAVKKDEHHEFTTLHYMPVEAVDTDVVEIVIRDDAGRRIPFAGGKVTLTLHLRRID